MMPVRLRMRLRIFPDKSGSSHFSTLNDSVGH
uniref:Uncharacterized protein n=1 Tax=Anguilla anguilla TaxID=7936 RepID=A0A0E9R245_ANGAN